MVNTSANKFYCNFGGKYCGKLKSYVSKFDFKAPHFLIHTIGVFKMAALALDNAVSAIAYHQTKYLKHL